MDQLFMFSSEYTVDDDNNAKKDCNKEEAKIKNEPEDTVVDEEDDSYIMPESLLQQLTTTKARDAEGEDDNKIFNFGIESSANKRPTPTVISKPSSAKNPQDAFINFDLAVMYICPACGSEFDTQTAWKSHINGVHEYNTRRGLNFVPIDKLYHRCLECNKPIAMHAMENLLKHKFTHLPHRCTKCRICHRLYKYRQDLIVHLRLCHREDVIEMMGDANKHDKNIYENVRTYVPPRKNAQLEIRDIKGNAIDIFENTSDSVEVKNEPFDADDPEDEDMHDQNKPKFHKTSILEDALSRKSSQESGQTQQANERQYEKHIVYSCPVCNSEFSRKNDWRDHLQEMHNFFSFDGLGLEKRSYSTVECLECRMVLPSYSIEPLQIHKFSHLPCKTYMRCKFCFRSFHNYKSIVKHLQRQHRLENGLNADADESQDGRSFDPYSVSSTMDFDDDQVPADEQGKFDCRDIYETQIDYLCPKCGEEFFERKLWRNHIVQAHSYTDLKTLCFEAVNEHQLQCCLCGKVITNAYGVQNAQQHYFTHLPHKAYIRCRICAKSYTDRKGLVKHLRKVHHISSKTMPSLSKPAETKSQLPTSFQKTPFKTPRKVPVKEIVRHNGVIYEIQFLDEDSNDDTFMDDTSSSIDARNDYSFAKPPKRHVCPDCYSTFGTAQELQKHIREQHDFKKPTQSHVCTRCYCTFESEGALQDHKLKHHSNNSDNLENNEANDDDDLLLVPSRNEEIKVSSSTSSTNIDQYFCYMCPACGDEFKSQYEWRRHINDIHYFDRRYELNFKQIDKFHFQCLECQEIVNGPKLKALQDHKFRHLPYKLYIKCRLCSTCYNHKPNVVTHLRIRHNLMDPREILNSSPSISPISSQMHKSYEKESKSPPNSFNIRSMTTEDIISNHNAVDHESITYRCPQCNDPFDTHALWRQHIVTAHDLNSRQGLNFRQLDAHHYICLECYKRVTVTHTKGAIGQLQSHKFRHLPYKSFSCTTCNGVFVRKQMFFKHLNRITNRCPLMGNVRVPNFNPKIKASNLSMARKMAGHGERMNTVKNLNFSVTSNERCPYIIQCPQCGIKFERWAPWRDHIEKEHALHSMETLKFKRITDHLHICLQCKERVTGANFVNLQTHRFKHLPYGTYLHCRYCDVRYYYMINIIKHMKQKHPNHGLKELELQLENTPDKESSESPSVDVCMELNDEKNNDNTVGDDNNDENYEEKTDQGHEKKDTVGKMVDYETSKCSYIIHCPQCDVKNDNWHTWREHIATVHSLDKLDTLNFTKTNDWVHDCNECKEQVNSTSLFTLQIHKFKHLPYSSYLQCRYCDVKFNYLMHIIRHLKKKHPEHAIQKHDKPIELDDGLLDDDDDVDEEDGEGTKDNDLDVDAEVDDEDEEEDDEMDDDDEDGDDNDDTVGANAVGMDVDDFEDGEDGEDDDEEDADVDDDVDDDDDDDEDEENEDDDGGSENFDNADTEVSPADDNENTNTEVPRGAVEDIEEVDESEQFVLG